MRKESKRNKSSKAGDYIEIDTDKLLEFSKNAAEVALRVIAGAGFISIAVLAPNLAGQIGKMYLRNQQKTRARQYQKDVNFSKTRSHIYYLRKQGYVVVRKEAGEKYYELSEKGKEYLKRIKVFSKQIEKPKVWQKTWWVVMADIPSKTHRIAADMLRHKLKKIGFYPLQRTVWVHPYNPTKELNELTEYYDLGKFVTILEAKRIDAEDEKKLLNYFNL